MRILLQFLLMPLSFLYNALTAFRNFLYDKKLLISQKTSLKTLVVGNLTVGGTGKSPHVEFLIGLLKNKYSVASLSRGYGRKTKGVILANSEHTAQDIGDEPMQFFLKFGNQISVAVAEKRIAGIKELSQKTNSQVVILDDAFQHRNLQADFYILLSDFNRPFYTDFLLPAGRLRESRKNAYRADCVIVTKCPQLSQAQQDHIEKQVRNYCRPDVPIFFTKIVYQVPQALFEKKEIDSSIILITGIAHSKNLYEYLSKKYQIVYHFDFDDHANYSEQKIKLILEKYQQLSQKLSISILTTEKDMVKLVSPSTRKKIKELPLFYLPIEVCFLKNQTHLEQMITDCLET